MSYAIADEKKNSEHEHNKQMYLKKLNQTEKTFGEIENSIKNDADVPNLLHNFAKMVEVEGSNVAFVVPVVKRVNSKYDSYMLSSMFFT